MNRLMKQLEIQNFLIVTHRGASGGNIIENTSEAANISLKCGSDIVEIDISMSRDDKFFVFHDGEERRLLHEDKNIRTLSSKEISQLYYYNSIDQITEKKVETLDTFLSNVKRNTVINIDRSWDYGKTFLSYLDTFVDFRECILLKSPINEDYLEVLNNHPIKYMYIPIISSTEDIYILSSFDNINVIGFEIIERTSDFELINSSEIIDYIEKGYMIFVNSIKLNDNTSLFGDLDDDRALLKGFDDVWGKMLDLGVNTIQTDWPYILNIFRKSLS